MTGGKSCFEIPIEKLKVMGFFTKIKAKLKIRKAKRNRSSSINLNGLGMSSEDLSNNNLRTIPNSITNLDKITGSNLKGNPLSLSSLLNISALNNSQRIFFLDEEHEQLLNQILNPTSTDVQYIARSVADDYPDTSVDAFNTLLKSLSDDQVRGIVEFDFQLYEVGVGLDNNGILSSELPWTEFNKKLFKEFVEMAERKEIEKIELLRENLRGRLFFGLSQDQINKMTSILNMEDMYTILYEKIIKENYPFNDPRKVLTELTEEDKDLARETFDENIMGLTQQKKKANISNAHLVGMNQPMNFTQQQKKANTSTASLVEMDQPMNSNQKEQSDFFLSSTPVFPTRERKTVDKIGEELPLQQTPLSRVKKKSLNLAGMG